MSHGVPPRWQPTIGSEEVTVPSLETHMVSFSNRFPLDGGVKAFGQSLEDFPTGHAQQKRLVGSGQIFSVAALESDNGFRSGYKLDGPSGVLG